MEGRNPNHRTTTCVGLGVYGWEKSSMRTQRCCIIFISTEIREDGWSLRAIVWQIGARSIIGFEAALFERAPSFLSFFGLGWRRSRYGFPVINLKPRSYPGQGCPYLSHLAHPGSLWSHCGVINMAWDFLTGLHVNNPPTLTRRLTHSEQPLLRGTPTIMNHQFILIRRS